MTATPPNRIDICVCTFRRSELADTLRSLAALRIPEGYSAGILVADNDDEPSARPIVTQLVQELNEPIRYIHCPARNISLARNTCLDASSAELIAFIDDDEIATRDWLGDLIATVEREASDVVLGPVRARYQADAPRWMREGDFHSTFPVWVQGEIRTGYTCNVLLRTAAPAIVNRRFSLARGRTGGEDTQFFDEVRRAGGTIAYAADAWVEEAVPAGRANLAWLVRRRFRVGQTHGRLLRDRHDGLGTVAQIALAAAKVAYCAGALLLAAARPVARNRALLRGIMHAGVVGGLFGLSELRQYGATQHRETKPHAGLMHTKKHPATKAGRNSPPNGVRWRSVQ